MLNKRSYELIYLQLKGQNRTTYNQVREQYQTTYNQRQMQTPFEKVWAKVLSKLRTTYNYRIPPKDETPYQVSQRMQTPIATRNEIELAKTRLRNYRGKDRAKDLT